MIINLSETLEIPLRERNALLEAAGYARVYSEGKLGDAEFKAVDIIVDRMLERHEPFSALLLNSRWDILKANKGHRVLWEAVTGSAPPRISEHPNLLVAALHPDGLRPYILNWDAIARSLLYRIRRELAANPRDEALQRLIEMVLELPGVREAWPTGLLPSMSSPILPLELRVGDQDIRLTSAITTLGTPQDAVAQEFRIESFFPADDESLHVLMSLAGSGEGDQPAAPAV